MVRAVHRSGIFWPPSTPAVTGPLAEPTLRPYALYYDLFDEVLTAGNVDETDSTDENALREVYDTLSDLHLDDRLIMDDNAVSEDPGLWHKTLSSGAWSTFNGYAVFFKVKCGAGAAFVLGLDDDMITGDITGREASIDGGDEGSDFGFYFFTGDPLSFPYDTDVYLMIVRRYDSNGYFYFYRTDEIPWTLAWIDEGPLISA